MSSYTTLKEKITKKKALICVIGLGYVGLPLAVAFAKKNFKVIGYDVKSSHVKKLKSGQRYIVDVDPKDVLTLIKKKNFYPTTDKKVLNKCDVIIVCVPTPLRKVKIPDISYVVKAAQDIKKHLRGGQLIVLESTSYPTTTREKVLPILKKSGLLEGKDYFLAFSPERVNPGDKKYPLTKIPKVVGGISSKASQLSKALYSKIIKKVFAASSPEVAETSKLLENTYRLVNIALVNEFALVCKRLGISIWEVIEAAKTKPFGYVPFYPGPGIGGHCIPCDPVYLSWKAKKLGFKTKMIDLASFVNHSMPAYVVERVKELLKKSKKTLKGAKVMILGVTYKKDVKDLRESPALDILELFKKKGSKISYYDPLIPYIKIDGLNLKRTNFSKDALKRFDCVVIVTDHSTVNYNILKKNAKLIFDAKNVYKNISADNIVKL